MSAPRHVVVVAGEASGDMHGARLAEELRGFLPDVRFSGIGGPAMEKAGVELIFRAEKLALVGISEVLPKLGTILSALRGIKKHLKQKRPDLLVLIDFPDFNFRVMKAASKLGVKVLYYICPQVWAWRQGRAKYMARYVDHLAVTFPFEPEFLGRIAPELNISFVGHPLLDVEPQKPEQFYPLPVPSNAQLVGLLPGSRMSEITRLLPLLLKAAAKMRERRYDLHFVLPVAPGLNTDDLTPYLKKAPAGLTVLPGRAEQVMAEARLLLAASGTATLQAALAGAPTVVVYKTGGLNYALARMLIKVDHIAMPNLVAGRRLLPELIQGEATPEAVAAEGLALLDDGPRRREMLDGLKEVKSAMGGPGATRRVAELAVEIMEGA
jgi:lipid-A-disaccharide synthase